MTALLACSLGCFGICSGPDPEPERNTCDNAPETAEFDELTVSGGLEVGGQGTTMLVARFGWRGEDVPRCAGVSVTATLRDPDQVIWPEEYAEMSTEANAAGDGRQSKGVLFTIPTTELLSRPEACYIRLTATSYGRTAEVIHDQCTPPSEPDAGAAVEPTDAGNPGDAGAANDGGGGGDAGARADAGD